MGGRPRARNRRRQPIARMCGFRTFSGPARRRSRGAPARHSCRRQASSPPAGADSGPCANPSRARRRRASAGRDIVPASEPDALKKVKASAVAPAKPAMTWRLCRSRRTLLGVALHDGLAEADLAIAATTVSPPFLTRMIVVACIGAQPVLLCGPIPRLPQSVRRESPVLYFQQCGAPLAGRRSAMACASRVSAGECSLCARAADRRGYWCR